MKQDLKKYTVTLAGERYNLISDDPEPSISQAVDMVNIILDGFSKNYDGDIRKIWGLVALQLASKVLALESQVSCIQKEHKALLDLIDQEILSLKKQ